MVSDASLPSGFNMPAPDARAKAYQPAIPSGRQPDLLKEKKGEATKPRSDKDARSKAVKQLSLRVEDSTHQKITLAAQKSGKSINAWIEEVVEGAADDVLERSNEGEITSGTIRLMIEDPDYSVRLIEGITPYLRDSSPPTIFQFSTALKKLLFGWDMLMPLLKREDLHWIADLAAHLSDNLSSNQSGHQSRSLRPVSSLVADALAFQAEDSTAVVQFTTVLKKLLLGMVAISPLIKEGKSGEKTENLLKVVVVIEELLDEIEKNAAMR